MARLGNRLTAAWVSKATTPGMYCDGHGLYLQVGPSGSKAWVFRYRRQGRLHDMGLGPLHTISLAQARTKALTCRQQLLAGIDPLAEKRRARQPTVDDVTFEHCANQYIASHRAGWKGDASAAQWSNSLATYAFPIIGRMPVHLIDTGLVMRVLDRNEFWVSKTETASRVRQRIEAILGWATTRGYRSGDNPARWRNHLENLLPKPAKVRVVVPHAALAADEIPAFLEALKGRQGMSARAIAFITYTAVRASEATLARWDEIDLRERVWTIPSWRMKGGTEHRVPLSPEAVAVLEHVAEIRHSDFVFPGQAGNPLHDNSMRALLADMGYGHITIHGLRASFSSWAGDSTGFAREIVEEALAHKVGNATERAYRRGDFFAKRRRLMEAWAKFCTTPRPQAAEVVQLRAG
jgi:integrase